MRILHSWIELKQLSKSTTEPEVKCFLGLQDAGKKNSNFTRKMNRYTILAVLALMLCSCGTQKRLAKEHKQLDIAYRALDSLNKELTIHALSKDIKTIDDKSRIVVTKYTGSRGKSSTNDANAEFMSKMRTLFDGANVAWQTGELGKVDEGGGGTVAKYVANLGVEVVDVGVPVLSMHAPFEVVSKLDVYMAYKGFKAFLEQ